MAGPTCLDTSSSSLFVHQQRQSHYHHHPDVDLVVVDMEMNDDNAVSYATFDDDDDDDDDDDRDYYKTPQESSSSSASFDDSISIITPRSVLDFPKHSSKNKKSNGSREEQQNGNDIQHHQQEEEQQQQQQEEFEELNIHEFLCHVKIVESTLPNWNGGHDSYCSTTSCMMQRSMSSTTCLFDENDDDDDNVVVRHQYRNIRRKKKNVTFSLLHDDDDSSLIAPSCIYVYENPFTSASSDHPSNNHAHADNDHCQNHDSNHDINDHNHPNNDNHNIKRKQSMWWTEQEVKEIRSNMKEKCLKLRKSFPQQINNLLLCYDRNRNNDVHRHQRDINYHDDDIPHDAVENHDFSIHFDYSNTHDNEHSIIMANLMEWVSSERDVRGLEKKVTSKFRQGAIQSITNVLDYQEMLLYQYECHQQQLREDKEEQDEEEEQDQLTNSNDNVDDNDNDDNNSINIMDYQEQDMMIFHSQHPQKHYNDDSNDNISSGSRHLVVVLKNCAVDDVTTSTETTSETTSTSSVSTSTSTKITMATSQFYRDYQYDELIRKYSMQNSYRSRLFAYRMALCDAMDANEIHQSS